MGETDISGLGLLEAHLGLDWAAETLGPNFLQHSPSTSTHAHSFSPNAPQHVHRALSHKATYTVSTYILSQPHSLYVDPLAGTPSHTQLPHKSQACHVPMLWPPTSLLLLCTHSPSFTQPAFLEGLLWGRPWAKLSVAGNQDEYDLAFAFNGLPVFQIGG